jgi:hypothetical protein
VRANISLGLAQRWRTCGQCDNWHFALLDRRGRVFATATLGTDQLLVLLQNVNRELRPPPRVPFLQ